MLRGLLSQANGGMGSDGSGGSTNGEINDSGCGAIAKAIHLTATDTLLDLGSSSGRACYSMCAQAGGPVCIGIECEKDRHNIYMSFAHKVMF